MATTYTPLRQDNGVDSWIAEETDGDGQVVSKYMVYDDPYKKASIRELEKLSAAEVDNFKQLLGVTGGGGTEGYTGMVPVFNGKYTSFLDFQNGLLVSIQEG